MHLLRTETHTLDDAVEAIDLAQSPADIVILSFSDSDLSAVAAAFDALDGDLLSLRLANLAQLRHPYSVDLYVEKVCARARFVLVRLLGGVDYWRYGVDELAAAARRFNFDLAIIPGDHTPDPRMVAPSTLDERDLRQLWGYFRQGGPANMTQLLLRIGAHAGRRAECIEPIEVPAFGLLEPACLSAPAGGPHALVIFYRSSLMVADTQPISALANSLHDRGFAVTSAFVTSLKDRHACAGVAALIQSEKPDIIVNTTAFSSRSGDESGVLERADTPILQAILAGSSFEQWQCSSRGLNATDLAMNVVLPEVDGRIVSRAISFKAKAERLPALEFTRIVHRAEPSRVDFVADLAAGWTRLRRGAPQHRKIACVLSDYPAKDGRAGYAVGLDTPASVLSIAEALRLDGYDIGVLPDAATLMRILTAGAVGSGPSVAEYRSWFATLPVNFRAVVRNQWGEPEDDPAAVGGNFRFRIVRAGKLLVAMQPDRGRAASRKSDYHSGNLPPCHAFTAFYLWLRHLERVDAMIHCGAHGTLEWLPGKAVALNEDCAPEVLLGPLPVIYPFIVNNPGEAAQAKRRLAAVIIGHLTPALTLAGSHGAAAELETLLDEYANAAALDPRRARYLAEAILVRAAETGLARECGVGVGENPIDALTRLDAWLCDLKEMRICDGLHVFGRSPSLAQREKIVAMFDAHSGVDHDSIERLLLDSERSEITNLLAALNGTFVEPGPGGAPSRGRLDVLPTGRNLYSVDPRSVPTRAAWEIGSRTAEDVMMRYAQDHGDWPRSIVMDLWGSATMRTGGDEIAQALAFLGVRPLWDHATSRIVGFEVLPQAKLERPRVDVTLRISGLFRDVFATQIALLDQAINAVAALDEDEIVNPLTAHVRRITPGACHESPVVRIFGAAPGRYDIGVLRLVSDGAWDSQKDLGRAYLDATTHSYGGANANADAGAAAFRERVGAADAFVHVQDMAEQDLLDSDAFAEYEGGFAAAAAALGTNPALYHIDSSVSERAKVRTLHEELARVVRARATNPRWVAGQMRHGFRGASEIAETVDNLFAFAAMTNAVESYHFDLLYDAICNDDRVRGYLITNNPGAARAIAARFEEAQKRGFWTSRRNSISTCLAEMREASA